MFCQFFFRQHLLICLQKLPFLLHLCQLLSSACHFHLHEPSKSICMTFVLHYGSQWGETTGQHITARQIFSYIGGISPRQAKAKGNSHEWFAAREKKETQESKKLARSIKLLVVLACCLDAPSPWRSAAQHRALTCTQSSAGDFKSPGHSSTTAVHSRLSCPIHSHWNI